MTTVYQKVNKFSGGDIGDVTPVSILPIRAQANTAVKLSRADGSRGSCLWGESQKTLLTLFLRLKTGKRLHKKFHLRYVE